MKESALKEYRKNGNLDLYQKSSALEVGGYIGYMRVEELIRLAEEMGRGKWGIAFCIGLSGETKRL